LSALWGVILLVLLCAASRAAHAALGVADISRLLLCAVAGAHCAPAGCPHRMSPLTIIFITIFIDLIGFGIIIPLMPFYAETFGATALTVGLLSTSFSFIAVRLRAAVGTALGSHRPPAGDSPRSVRVVRVLHAFGLARSLVVLFIARIFAGIAGANISTAQAYVADVTTPENRARGMGLVGAAFGPGIHLRSGDRWFPEQIRISDAVVFCGGAVARELCRRLVRASGIAQDGRCRPPASDPCAGDPGSRNTARRAAAAPHLLHRDGGVLRIRGHVCAV
jgi:uncharacterized membrane protein